MFSAKSFIVSGLTFRSLIHFEFIFVYGVRKFIAIQSYLKKQEKHWIDSLALHLKQLEKEDRKKTKLVEGKKS